MAWTDWERDPPEWSETPLIVYAGRDLDQVSDRQVTITEVSNTTLWGSARLGDTLKFGGANWSGIKKPYAGEIEYVDTGGGGGGSSRPTSGMLYPRGTG